MMIPSHSLECSTRLALNELNARMFWPWKGRAESPIPVEVRDAEECQACARAINVFEETKSVLGRLQTSPHNGSSYLRIFQLSKGAPLQKLLLSLLHRSL